METVAVKMQFPKDVFLHWSKAKEQIERDVKKAVALQLFREKRLSFGKSADLADMCLSDFMDLTREYKIPLVDYSEEELEKEILSSKKLAEQIQEE